MQQDRSEALSSVSSRMSASLWVLGRRRQFLVPGPDQVRSILTISLLSLVLLAVMDVVFYWLLRAQTATAVSSAPELEKLIRGQDVYQMRLIVLASFVALCGVVATALFETHKTAGPMYNLVRTMDRLAAEGPAVRLRFRKEDHFQEVTRSFNGMAEALEGKVKRRTEEIGRITDALHEEANELSRPASDQQRSVRRLRELAENLQKLG